MGRTALWAGFDRQIRSPAAVEAFRAARTRRPALAPYDSLAEVVGCERDCATDDALLSAFVAEHRSTSNPVWLAALTARMKGPLRMLVRRIESVEGDPASVVLLAFLEVATRSRVKRRLGFRLYSETRRRVLRGVARQWKHAVGHSSFDIDAIITGPGARNEVECVVDMVRLARALASNARRPDESPAHYVARLRGPRRDRTCKDVSSSLAHQRRQGLDDLRNALVRAT
jgi:hypothetical protein